MKPRLLDNNEWRKPPLKHDGQPAREAWRARKRRRRRPGHLGRNVKEVLRPLGGSKN